MKARNRSFVVLTLVVASAWVGGSRAGEDDRLEQIRRRLRTEAGVAATDGRNDDLPMVALTVLPGDTDTRLAQDLGGFPDAAAILRKTEPTLRPGEQIYVPRTLLAARLADPRLESRPLGGRYPTLWRLAAEGTRTGGIGVAATVRNLQRLNAIADPTRIPAGARILVPRSLLASHRPPVAPTVKISETYRVTDVSGMDRSPRPEEFGVRLRTRLQREGHWERQLAPRPVDLVVIHTTEHRGAPFQNVARYLQRKRLANYLIGPEGAVYRIVPEQYRAYGCGQSLWEGLYVVDHGAVNVEIFADTAPGSPGTGISPAQYEGLRGLLGHLRSRHPSIHEGRIVTHRMVAVSYTYGTRSRKGDPYRFDWTRAGLPDNSRAIDQDVLLGRAKLCTDERYSDRVTPGQTAANRLLRTL